LSIFNPNHPIAIRARMLASSAVVAIVASGAAGGAMMSAATPAFAAAVDTSSLQPSGLPSFAAVVERVKPAVVSVKVNIEEAAAQTDEHAERMGDGSPDVQQFFNRHGETDGGAPDRQAPRRGVALGSGFLIAADGYIVTNNHVVEHAKTVTVTMEDGKTLDARVIGTDEKTDLALLKVNASGNYPFVKLSRDVPRVGDWVVAIGNPFGLGGTVTAGIISAEGRDIGSGPYDSYLQIDAPINKGNSGGPTFNLKGEVVGVNTAIFSPSGGSIGLGFAIPASTVDSVVASLEHGGVVSRGFLGVHIQPVSQDIADGLGLKGVTGALVAEAQPGTPAAEAGLKSGDVITKLNGQDIKDPGDLTRHVGVLEPGEKIALSYLRDGAETTTSITLAAQKSQPADKAQAAPADSGLELGVQLAPGEGHAGVAIVGVNPDGLAASKGLANGDVILEVAGKPVTQPAEVKALIASAKQDGRKAVMMLVRTADASRVVAFAFAKA
jgi:serine protease Do